MSGRTVAFFLTCVIVVFFLIILYQRYAFSKGMQRNLKKMNEKLAEILETGSEEKVMIFTENKNLMELGKQMNHLLIDRQKVKVDYKKAEISSKKMLSNISHDIKTPLTVILGYLEIIRMDDQDNEMLKKVEEKAKQVMELVGQFFTLAKLEAGDMNLELVQVDINEVCRETILTFYEILLKKEFEVDINIPEKISYVWGEKDAIQRVLQNLISNVIRYGQDGKYIGLFLREEDKSVWVDVVDKGKGIEREFQSSVFDRLYTMEDSRNREIQGNGLGLTIVKHLAEQMGGSISLKSEPGVTTIFSLELKKINF